MLKDKYAFFDVSIENKIAHIRMNRPETMNAMNADFWNELPDIVEAIDGEALARVIVISSTGKHFSAGMDLSVFTGGGSESGNNKPKDKYIAVEAMRSRIPYIQHSFTALEAARIPVLIACHGGVIGGAVDMISAADIRWCTKDAFFAIQEINIGMTADVGTFPRLQRIIPEGIVRELAYTGRRLPADRAKELGLVNEIYDSHEDMMAAVMETAREIASKNPIAVTGSKVLINYGRDHSTAETLDYIGLWNAGMFPPEHMAEAFKAKQEKRDADFPDLAPIRRKPM